MITRYHAIREIGAVISDAIDLSIDALREGRVEQEPAFTDRMLGAIEGALNGYRTKGIRWSAKTLTDRGKNSQESRHGADFMGVLNIALPDFTVSKGFLAQAKMVRGRYGVNMRDLREQCERMLNLSSASFVFLYSREGVRVIPAVAVLGSDANLLDHYSRSASRFFEEHLECFIGDRNIQSATPDSLEALCERYECRSALLLRAEEGAFH